MLGRLCPPAEDSREPGVGKVYVPCGEVVRWGEVAIILSVVNRDCKSGKAPPDRSVSNHD